ncbi:uncharacterized protein LOC116842328 [Odontomachus brunneus]|uniref:uncharacterized protein LOC116842328 n=1 Tax=Odontomachus brunneus TaxID=486640 RepID=UPI0013F2872D|nr:uncharacterized protein LOC116842328 [Odontomachus brunneus]
MRPIAIHQKYSSEERINDVELDLLLEVNINENASVSSRRSSNQCRVSSNMDHDDLWEVTILPSLSSQATSSNDTLGTSVRVLNTITETKRGMHSSIDGRKGENEAATHKSAVRPKIAISSTYEKLNHDHSRLSFTRDKRSTSASRGDEKEFNRVDEKLSNKRFGVCKDNEWRAPFIELGAVYKVLDFITDSDPKVSSLTNSCCNEISRTLRYLIALSSDKKLDDLLSNDPSLYRCERCGVISHMLGPVIEEIKRSRTRAVQDADIAIVERDCINRHHRDKKKSQISTSHSNSSHNAQSRMFVDNCEVDRRVKHEGKLNEKSLPVKERSFVMRRRIESPNGANDISATETDANAKIKNTSLNNSAIKRLFADYEAARRNTGYDSNCATRNDRFCHVKPSTTSKIRANIDKEIVVRKISYENKSQFTMEGLRSRGTRKSQGQRRLFEKDDDVLSVGNTVKYLAGGQLTVLDKGENDLLSKLQDRCRICLEEPRKGQSSVLYGSRDDYYPRCDPGFWLFDKSGHLPEVPLDEYHFLPMPRLDDSSDGFRARNMGKSPRKTGSWTECVEKDSLENCTLLERRQDSDTTTFSSSSAENLMYEWIGALDEKDNTNDTYSDVPRGRPLVSSRPSLDIARHVKAKIAEARRPNDTGESMGEAQSHNSDVLARLSSETRNKMCHSIRKMILSDAKNSVFCHEKDLATCIDATNSEKLAPKSSNVTFVHSDKSFSFLIERRANVVEVCSPSMDKSKDHVQISHEYSTAVVPADELRKTQEKFAGDSYGRVSRRIVYKNLSSENVDNDDGQIVTEISPVYREILQNSEDMDWDGFRELIERLHPGQKELWRDICKTVDEEAARLSGDANGSMEVCIEISPVILGEYLKTDKPMACAREIAFELDMTMKDVESFLDKRPHLAEERLDTHKATDENVTDWNDSGRKPISEQTR